MLGSSDTVRLRSSDYATFKALSSGLTLKVKISKFNQSSSSETPTIGLNLLFLVSLH